MNSAEVAVGRAFGPLCPNYSKNALCEIFNPSGEI